MTSRAYSRLAFAALLVALLLGAALRLGGLGAMQHELQYDEAYYAMNAISLLQQPRVQLFFPENTGREGLWMYLLAPAIALWGALPFTLRYVAALVAILTLAAMARLAREILGVWGAAWATLALGGLYVHLHNSHVAFRVLLFPLVGALALAWLLRAHRTNQPRAWIIAGLFAGLLAYTYTAAHGWLTLLLALALLWALGDARRRRGALTLLGTALLLAAPLYSAMLLTPVPDGGLGRTLVTSGAELRQNIQNWLDAWTVYGDLNHNHNIPNLPLLDTPQTFLISVGLVGAWFVVRRRWIIGLLLALFVLALLPSLITLRTPQYIRAFGLVIPVALALAAGALALQGLFGRLLQRWMNGRHAAVTLLPPALLLGASCIISAANFQRWLATYDLNLFIDTRVNAAMRFIREQTAPDLPLYIPYSGLTPETTLTYHPVAAFHAYQMGRPLAFFPFPEAAETCFVLPRRPALYLDFPNIVSRLGERSAAYGSVTPLYQQPDQEYNIWQITPPPAAAADWERSAVMGDRLQVQALPPFPAALRPGAVLTVSLGMRALRPITYPYRVFLHLQGAPTPYEGGTLYATGDAPLCAAALRPDRTPQEVMIQHFTLALPVDLAPGAYHVAVGIYDAADNQRLPIASPGGETRFYRAVDFSVTAP